MPTLIGKSITLLVKATDTSDDKADIVPELFFPFLNWDFSSWISDYGLPLVANYLLLTNCYLSWDLYPFGYSFYSFDNKMLFLVWNYADSRL